MDNRQIVNIFICAMFILIMCLKHKSIRASIMDFIIHIITKFKRIIFIPLILISMSCCIIIYFKICDLNYIKSILLSIIITTYSMIYKSTNEKSSTKEYFIESIKTNTCILFLFKFVLDFFVLGIIFEIIIVIISILIVIVSLSKDRAIKKGDTVGVKIHDYIISIFSWILISIYLRGVFTNNIFIIKDIIKLLYVTYLYTILISVECYLLNIILKYHEFWIFLKEGSRIKKMIYLIRKCKLSRTNQNKILKYNLITEDYLGLKQLLNKDEE